jgi:hypothetical protein
MLLFRMILLPVSYRLTNALSGCCHAVYLSVHDTRAEPGPQVTPQCVILKVWATQLEVMTMNVELSEHERELLATLAEGALSETRVEVRRTRNPDWREDLQTKEHDLQMILDKLRAMQGTNVA